LDDAVYERLRVARRSSASRKRIDPIEKDLRAHQFKILDLGRTLFFIWQRSLDRQSRKAAKTAVKQWAHINFGISDMRRRNLLKQTYPSFLSLLKRVKNFKSKEYSFLFGDHFLFSLDLEGKMLAYQSVGAIGSIQLS